MRTRENSQSS